MLISIGKNVVSELKFCKFVKANPRTNIKRLKAFCYYLDSCVLGLMISSSLRQHSYIVTLFLNISLACIIFSGFLVT